MRILMGSISFALVACGGGGSTDIQGTLVFAERSDTKIARIISAAGGGDMFAGQAQVDQFGDTFDGDVCPNVEVSGTTATVTGGCTREDGTMITGAAVVENPAGWDQIDWFGGDSRYELHELGFTFEGGTTMTYDGFIARTDNFTTWDADLTVTSFGVTIRSDLHYECEDPASPSCDLTNSGIELIGVGGALVSGNVHIEGQSQVSDFTLRGVDRMTVHIEGGCIGWQIEGTDRRAACLP